MPPAPRGADELGLIDWDDVVDVVCTGTGAGGVAAAVVAGMNGLQVLVADGPPGVQLAGNADADTLPGRLGITDTETVDYLASLTQDIGPLTRITGPEQLPVRSVDGPVLPAVGRAKIATFVGSALRDWSACCLASSHGVLNTHVVSPGATVTFTTPSGTVEAAVVGAIDLDPGRSAVGLDDWLVAAARDHGIAMQESSSLQRLIFEAGEVVGAIIDTPAGPRSVRARRGVVVETGAAALTPGCSLTVADATTAQVALVTRPASRFARLELLVENRDL